MSNRFVSLGVSSLRQQIDRHARDIEFVHALWNIGVDDPENTLAEIEFAACENWQKARERFAREMENGPR